MANDPGARLVALVGAGRTVLHLGCGDGTSAAALVDQGCAVSGVDPDPALVERAAGILGEVVVADLDATPLVTMFKPGTFDVVVADDLVHRLADPVRTLREAGTLLAEGGRLLLPARNAAYGGLRLQLLLGRPDRRPTPALTFDALCALLEDAGLVVDEVHSTVSDPLAGAQDVDSALLPSEVVEWVRHQPGALDEHYWAVARPADPGDPFATRPEVTPAVSADEARLDDEHTRWVRQDREERHRMLTVRDHILGLEASLTSADARVTRARMRARAANVRARRAKADLEALVEEIEALVRTRGGRADLRHLAVRLREARDQQNEQRGDRNESP